MAKLLIYMVSLVVCGIPMIAGIRAARADGRWAHRSVLAGIAALGLTVGALSLAGRAGDVSVLRALIGSAIGALGIGIPLALWFELGYRIRSQLVLTISWLLSALPLYFYAAVLFLMVAAYVHCPPHAYECPV